MLKSSTLTRVSLENIAIDFLVEQWEKRYRLEVRALAEMIGCATHAAWGRFPEESTPHELRAGADGGEAFDGCVELYRAKHAIAEDELAAALADFRMMNGTAPSDFADRVLRHTAVEKPNPPRSRSTAVQRHAKALRDQAAALEVVRVTNGELKAFRKACSAAGRFTPADKRQVHALVVRQVAEKAVLHAANDAVRAAKAGIKEESA